MLCLLSRHRSYRLLKLEEKTHAICILMEVIKKNLIKLLNEITMKSCDEDVMDRNKSYRGRCWQIHPEAVEAQEGDIFFVDM